MSSLNRGRVPLTRLDRKSLVRPSTHPPRVIGRPFPRTVVSRAHKAAPGLQAPAPDRIGPPAHLDTYPPKVTTSDQVETPGQGHSTGMAPVTGLGWSPSRLTAGLGSPARKWLSLELR